MFQNSTTILRLFGIEIKVAASWFLIAALIMWSLADQIFPAQVPGLSSGHYLLLGTMAMLLFFVSLLLHELAHAMVAKAFGIDVPRITLFLFGGVAELGEEPGAPSHEFLIAVAGPVVSLALAIIFWFLSVLSSFSVTGTALPTVLTYLATINLVLAVFNLLPAFPLDGGRVLRALLWSRTGDILTATEKAARLGEFLGFGLMALGVLSLFQGVQLGGAWQILIGIFILFAARGAVEAQRTKTLLSDQTVADLMSQEVIIADPEMTLADLVNRIMLPNRVSFVPVVEHSALLGHIDTEVLSMIDRENWPNTRVGDVFVNLETGRTVSPQTSAAEVLGRFSEMGHRKLVVIDDGQLAGIVTLSDLSRLLQLLSELHLRHAEAA